MKENFTNYLKGVNILNSALEVRPAADISKLTVCEIHDSVPDESSGGCRVLYWTPAITESLSD